MPRPDLALLRLRGEDRLRFLNGQITCQVANLIPGDGVYGYFVTLKGRVEADCMVLAAEDAVFLVLPAAARDGIAERLRKYVVVDRVEIEAIETVATTLVGHDLRPVVTELLGEPPAESPWSHSAARLAGAEVPVRAVRHADRPRPATGDPLQLVTLWLATDADARLRTALDALAVEALDEATWTALRVELGLPLHGRDIGLDHFPHEVADEETLATAIDYTKGCYLGQEVVARIHYRGGVQRRLVGVRLDVAEADAALDPARLEGTDLLAGGRAVATLGSVARAPHLGLIGLAVAHRRAEDGSRVDGAPDDESRPARGELVALPFSLD
ncbi:MAG: hypothetical protein AAGC60_18430 [Acidobacteriota bacterium]